MSPAPVRARGRRLPWLVLALGVAGAIYGAMGSAMIGSFAAADPPGAPSRNTAAIVYLVLMLVSIALAIAGAAMLVRQGPRRSASGPG